MIQAKINKPLNIQGIELVEGETIEEKVERIMNNGEPITDNAPMIYTERKDGVAEIYDIRSDRFDMALDATTKIEQSLRARREEYHKQQEDKLKEQKGGNDETVA